MASRFQLGGQQDYSPYKSPNQSKQPYEKGGYAQDNQLLSTNAKSGFMSNGDNDQLRVTVNSNQAQPLKFSNSINQSSFRSTQGKAQFRGGRDEPQVEDLDVSRASHQTQSMNQSVANENQGRGQQQNSRQQENQNDNDPRDGIIKSYYDEIAMHQGRNRDFEKLRQMISDLRYKCHGLEQQLSSGELRQMYEQSLQSQAKQIEHLQRENEQVKREINDRNMEGIRVVDEIQHEKGEGLSQDEQLYYLGKDLDKVQVQNDLARREVDMLVKEINSAQELRQNQQMQIYNQRNEGRIKEQEMGDQEGRLREMEQEHRSNMEKIKIMNDHLEHKQQNLEGASYALYKTQDELAQLQRQNEMLDLQIAEVEASNQRQVEAQKRLYKQKEAEGARGQEQVGNQKANEEKIRDQEMQLELFRRDMDAIRGDNEGMYERNGELAMEVKELGRHCDVLLQQNRELQYELDSFIAQDDIIRQNLDRKDKVQTIRTKVDDVIKKSVAELMQKSPQRKRQHEGHQSYGNAPNQSMNDSSYKSPY